MGAYAQIGERLIERGFAKEEAVLAALAEEFGIERLFLVSHGRRLPIAAFLGPQEKESFATALDAAIGEAKRGPTRTVLD